MKNSLSYKPFDLALKTFLFSFSCKNGLGPFPNPTHVLTEFSVSVRCCSLVAVHFGSAGDSQKYLKRISFVPWC